MKTCLGSVTLLIVAVSTLILSGCIPQKNANFGIPTSTNTYELLVMGSNFPPEQREAQRQCVAEVNYKLKAYGSRKQIILTRHPRNGSEEGKKLLGGLISRLIGESLSKRGDYSGSYSFRNSYERSIRNAENEKKEAFMYVEQCIQSNLAHRRAERYQKRNWQRQQELLRQQRENWSRQQPRQRDFNTYGNSLMPKY